MITHLSKSEGDYLKAIYSLTLEQDTTSTVALAEVLQVKPPSVTSMLTKLSKQTPPLVSYQKRQGVCLTEAGKLTTLRLLRRHRLLELFLAETLNYNWEDVHAEADELEHVISQKFEEGLASLLGNPSFDPHGDPIPDQDLNLPYLNTIPLCKLEAGQKAIIRRVQLSQPDILHHLGQQGIQPGAPLELHSRNPFDNTLQLMIGASKHPYALGAELGKAIFVEVQQTI